jgi:hypothetical protein
MKQTTEVSGNQIPEACSSLSHVSTHQARASPVPTRYYVYALPFLALHFHEKDLPPTPRLLRVWLILPPLGHILSIPKNIQGLFARIC